MRAQIRRVSILRSFPSAKPPFRTVGLATFALAAGLVAACGHQVTPEPSVASSDLTGNILARFDTTGALNFAQYSYAIVMNTCGTGLVPYPNVYGTTYLSYTYVFFVGGSTSGTSQVSLWEYYFVNNQVTKLQIQINPSSIQFNPNSNGQNTEFQLIFSRSLMNNHFGLTQPCVNVTQPPATPTPVSTATGVPTAGPTTAPTAGATTTPGPEPTTVSQSNWIFNYMTFTGTPPIGVPVDSLGIEGPTDNTYPGITIDVNTQQNMPIFRQAPQKFPSDPSAEIAGGELDNYP